VTKSIHDPQQHFITLANEAASVSTNPGKNARMLWFRNPTNHDSLRLTRIGFTWFFGKAGFTFHKIELASEVTGRQLIQLERLFTAPYVITQKTIHVMSEQDAVMLQLHAGNLAQYLDNLQDNT